MERSKRIFSLLFVGALLLTSCGKEKICEHKDDNNDHLCDICNEALPYVASVKINETLETLGFGRTSTLTVTVDAKNGAQDKVTWSTDSACVSLTQVGNSVKVEGIKSGIAEISVKSDFDGSVLDSIRIEVLDWSSDDLSMMVNYLGERLPYFEGDFSWTDEYSVDLGFLSAEAPKKENLALVAEAFKKAGWDVEGYDDGTYKMSHLSKTTSNCILTGSIYIENGISVVDIYLKEYNSLEWPVKKLYEMLNFETKDPEIIPSFDAKAYLIQESKNDYADIEIYGFGAIDLISYFNELVEAGWSYSTSYLNVYGCYVTHSPRESLEVDIYPELNRIDILKFGEPLPFLDSWPTSSLLDAASRCISGAFNVPGADGEKFCISFPSGGYYFATVLVYGGNYESYSEALKEAGFSIVFNKNEECYIASSSNLIIEIKVVEDHFELNFRPQE